MILEKVPLIEMLLKANVLSFGEFTLKSGRVSPYFFNLGYIFRGNTLGPLAESYAALLNIEFPEANTLFGPAYKGIPLASTTAVSAFYQHQKILGVAFDRKEAKAHGEGGEFVGSALSGNIVLVDDVITAGSAVRSSLEKINRALSSQDTAACVQGLVVAMDRQESFVQGGPSAIQALEQETGLKVASLLCFADLLDFIECKPEFSEYKPAMIAYRERYGAL